MMEAADPPFKTDIHGIPQPSLSDNTNIQVFPFHGEALATTDSALYTRFNPDTLETIGKVEFPTATQGLSASHLHYLPGSDKKTIVNYYTNIFAVKNHEIQVFKMGADHTQQFFGKTTVPYLPYVHSFGLTQKHMLLFAYPLGFAEACTLEFKPLLECAKWYDHNVTLFVFPLDGKEGDPPKMTLQLSSHFSLHHVNAWEDEEAFWIDANSYFDGSIFLGKFVHADLHTMRDQSLRDKVAPWSRYTRLRIDRAKETSTMQSIHLADKDGYVYDFDFPVIHPEKDANRHCIVWGITAFAKNSTEYAHWAVLKSNVCSGLSVNTVAWSEANQYPSEPMFVPKPGATAEDDGVLLVQAVDGPKSTTYLLVLDAKTMKELARAYLPTGWSTPYTQHGNWFPAVAKSVMV
jgi:carotenoid cleavage dioxygenase-like enzyme